MAPTNRPPTPEAAQLLQTVREALGLSVTQMAQALGMNGDAACDNIRQMERGARPVSNQAHLILRYMAPGARVALAPAPPELAPADSLRVRLLASGALRAA